MIIKPYTMSYNKDKCIARTWKKGILDPDTQNQCTRKRVNGDFCKCHFEKGGMSWPFGIVTEPVPSKIIYDGKEKQFKIETVVKKVVKKVEKKVIKKEEKKVEKKVIKKVVKEEVEKKVIKKVVKDEVEKKVEKKKKSLTDLVPESSDEEDEELVVDYDFINIQGVEYYMHQSELKVYEADSSGKHYRFLTELGCWDKSLGSVKWNNPEIEENEKNRGHVV